MVLDAHLNDVTTMVRREPGRPIISAAGVLLRVVQPGDRPARGSLRRAHGAAAPLGTRHRRLATWHNEVPRELRATGQQLDAMIARLEQTIVADSALNQLRLRPQVEREIVRRGGRIDFTTLNAWIYAEVFRTPRQAV